MVAVIQDLILQLHAVSKPWEGTAIVTFIVTDTMTAVQIYLRLTASVSFNTYMQYQPEHVLRPVFLVVPISTKKTAPVVKEASLQQSLCKLHKVTLSWYIAKPKYSSMLVKL